MRAACGVIAMVLVGGCGKDAHPGATTDAAADAVDAAPAPDVGPVRRRARRAR